MPGPKSMTRGWKMPADIPAIRPAPAATAVPSAINGSAGAMTHHRERLSTSQREAVKDARNIRRLGAQADRSGDHPEQPRRGMKAEVARVGPAWRCFEALPERGLLRVEHLVIGGGERERLASRACR